jgi:hypothetical protein
VPPNLGAAAPQKSIERAQAFEFALTDVGSLVWKRKQNTSKNRERDRVLALDGRHSIEGHNNQLKVSGSGGGAIGEEAQLGQNVWGIAKPLFRPWNQATNK